MGIRSTKRPLHRFDSGICANGYLTELQSGKGKRTNYSRNWCGRSKLEPEWDVHFAGSLAGMFRTWIAGLSGTSVSP